MKKLLSTTIAVGILATTSVAPVFANVDPTALPQLNSATNADITTKDTNMNIQITGGQGSVGTMNWDSFNVGKDASVNFEFSAHNQTALNKVAATGGLSQIYGKITDSGCANCGYEATGKVILLNPNGVFFGSGANVDVNSFTASTMSGVFDKENNKLNLTREFVSPYGIVVEDGATIYGDKNVAFASDNVKVYTGSKISTNIGNNVGDTAYGKIKIVTADGVNFAYYNNGAIKGIDGIVGHADPMKVNINGELTSGHIDIRNYSSNVDSEVNLNGAALKAVKAVKGNDGNIWLTATNKIVVDDSNLDAGNDASLVAVNKNSVKDSTIKSARDIEIISEKADAVVDNSTLTADRNIIIKSGNIASAQKGSTLTAGNDITIEGVKRAQAHQSTLVAGNQIDVVSDNDVWVPQANLKAKKINLTAKAGNVTGDADLNGNLTNINAGKDINVTLENVDNADNGLVAIADQNVTIKTDSKLSVGHLVAKNGDMTLESNGVIAGRPYTKEEQIPGDERNDRSYIYVANGNFTSKTPFNVTNSDTLIKQGTAQLRHHIEYDNAGATEHILLINPMPYTPEPTPPAPEPQVVLDGEQAQMLNKLPIRPESYNTNNPVADTRTVFMDVFAAASQIEIEDDEE